MMGIEDSYCDMWSRPEVIGHRTRSIATASMMVAASNVGDQFELRFHAPGVIYNGVTLEKLEAIIVQARDDARLSMTPSSLPRYRVSGIPRLLRGAATSGTSIRRDRTDQGS